MIGSTSSRVKSERDISINYRHASFIVRDYAFKGSLRRWMDSLTGKSALATQSTHAGSVARDFVGRELILTAEWAKELDYRLIKELWAYTGNRIAVRFAYEWHDDSGNWFRSYGNENWEFDDHGLMRFRYACINDLPIKESERKYHWPLGRRPDAHPGLSDLGL